MVPAQLFIPLVTNWFVKWLHCTAVYTCILIVQSVLLNSAQAELSNTVNFIGCNFKQALLKFAKWLPCTAVYTCTLIVQSVLLNSAQAELNNTVNFIGCNFKQELLNCPLWISQNQKV